MSQSKIKETLGLVAAELVEARMTIGLGTGSTAYCFIQALGTRCRETGLQIRAVGSSRASCAYAAACDIPLIDIASIGSLDLTVDGADEIDPHKRMIKGGGGAFVREKIVAAMSRDVVIVVDETKLSAHLGKRKLPVEILPFGHNATMSHLRSIGYQASWRTAADGALFLTDNGNYIIDISYPTPPGSPEEEERQIHAIPGVIDTGFFLNIARHVIVGYADGRVVHT